jgi:hypothetical protein
MARCKSGDLVIIERGNPEVIHWDCLCYIGRMFTVTVRDVNTKYPALIYWRVPPGWRCDHIKIVNKVWDEVCRPIRPSPTLVDIDVGEPEVLTP